jgi:hypothetical protein
LPARGFRYPTSLAFELARETSAHPGKVPNLDAALCGIKVNSGHSHLPIEFEFNVLLLDWTDVFHRKYPIPRSIPDAF